MDETDLEPEPLAQIFADPEIGRKKRVSGLLSC